MTEQQHDDQAIDRAIDRADEQVEQTGHPVVDDVVASLSDLGDRPVAEHVGVFESAHDRLRGALADAGSSDEPA